MSDLATQAREHKNTINRAYYQRHRERLSAEETARRRVRGPEENRRRSLKDRSTPRGFLLGLACAARQRSVKRGIEFSITRDYLVRLFEEQEGCCALTGQPMTMVVGQGRVRTNISVDRIDAARGYVEGNLQLVCDHVNRAKGDLTTDEFIEMCRRVAR
jgi:hypothetical protein